MPLTNAINKRSDTFFATSNITANFTSPVLTTAVNTITYTNTFVSVIQTTNTSALTTEYYGAQSAANGNASTIVFYRAIGTKASPTSLTGTADADNTLIGQIRFDFLATSVRAGPQISVYGNSNSQKGLIQITSPFNSSTQGYRFLYPLGRFIATGSIISHPSYNLTPTDNPVSGPPFAGNRSGTSVSSFSIVAANEGANLGCLQVVYSNNTSSFGGTLFLGRTRSTLNAPTSVVNGDVLGSINFAGTTGTSINAQTVGATIDAVVENAVSTGVLPSRMVFNTANSSGTITEAMRIDSAQRITQPLQPSFSASLSADVANATGDGTAYTVAFNTEQYDQGNNFATNTFTAPIAGRYRFAYTISVDDLLVGHTKMEVTVGGQTVCRVNPYAIADSDGFCLLNGSVDLSLAASATVTMVVTVSGSTKTVTVKGTTTSGTFLSGQLQV